MEGSSSFYYSKILPVIHKKYRRPLRSNKKTKAPKECFDDGLFSELLESKTKLFKSTENSVHSSRKELEPAPSLPKRHDSMLKFDQHSSFTNQIEKILEKIANSCKYSSRPSVKKKRPTKTKSYEDLQNMLEEYLTNSNKTTVDPADVKEFKDGQDQLHLKASFMIKKPKATIR